MKNMRIFKSIRNKLFVSLCIIVLLIITFLIILNNCVLGKFYLYNKKKNIKTAYTIINNLYNNENSEEKINAELDRISIKNDFDILIKDEYNQSIYISNKDFFSTLETIDEINKEQKQEGEIIQKRDKFVIKQIKDKRNGMTYILLSSVLDNGYLLYIRIPINSIQESVKISNNFLYLMAGITIVISAVIISFVSRRFTDPILELNDIAKRMSNLDFSRKYTETKEDDEIDNLGRSINIMSDKLEKTIKQLKDTNIELEKDIEEKSKRKIKNR